MRNLKHVLIFGLVLMIFAGCSKEEIQPDPLNTADEISLKGAKVKKGPDHCVPFKASFTLTASYDHFGPIVQKDFQEPWPFGGTAPGMYVEIKGKGKATHLGLTEFVIDQWWTRAHPSPPPAEPPGFWSFGQGEITFTAANGDQLFATYWGWADHLDDPPTEILTHGTFIGGTGRFEDAAGYFTWDGLFVGTFKPDVNTTQGTVFGAGEVKVTGTINY
jgi:hypothetical protein